MIDQDDVDAVCGQILQVCGQAVRGIADVQEQAARFICENAVKIDVGHLFDICVYDGVALARDLLGDAAERDLRPKGVGVRVNEYNDLHQFLSEWIGAGILPPRAINFSQETGFTRITGA